MSVGSARPAADIPISRAAEPEPPVVGDSELAQLMRARYLKELVSVTDYSGGVFTVARLVEEIEGVHQHAR